jgi:hypothetical protein
MAHRKDLFRKRNRAQTALNVYEERMGKELRNLANIVRKWAERKKGRELDWLTAIWDLCSRTRRPDPTRTGEAQDSTAKKDKNRQSSSGSLPFYAFPQLVVDQIVERTGGRPITVAVPSLVDGEVRIDEGGNVYLIDETPDGAGGIMRRETLVLQVPGDGRVLSDGGRPQQGPRFAVAPGSAEVRGGKLTFPNTQQRPGVPKPKEDK